MEPNKPAAQSAGPMQAASVQSQEVEALAQGGQVGSGGAYMWAEGSQEDYTPGADTTAGTLVNLGGYVGLVDNDIAANELGAVSVEGLVKVKNSGGIAGARGAQVDLTVATQQLAASGSGDVHCGRLAAALVAGDSHGIVALNKTTGKIPPAGP